MLQMRIFIIFFIWIVSHVKAHPFPVALPPATTTINGASWSLCGEVLQSGKQIWIQYDATAVALDGTSKGLRIALIGISDTTRGIKNLSVIRPLDVGILLQGPNGDLIGPRSPGYGDLAGGVGRRGVCQLGNTIANNLCDAGILSPDGQLEFSHYHRLEGANGRPAHGAAGKGTIRFRPRLPLPGASACGPPNAQTAPRRTLPPFVRNVGRAGRNGFVFGAGMSLLSGESGYDAFLEGLKGGGVWATTGCLGWGGLPAGQVYYPTPLATGDDWPVGYRPPKEPVFIDLGYGLEPISEY